MLTIPRFWSMSEMHLVWMSSSNWFYVLDVLIVSVVWIRNMNARGMNISEDLTDHYTGSDNPKWVDNRHARYWRCDGSAKMDEGCCIFGWYTWIWSQPDTVTDCATANLQHPLTSCLAHSCLEVIVGGKPYASVQYVCDCGYSQSAKQTACTFLGRCQTESLKCPCISGGFPRFDWALILYTNFDDVEWTYAKEICVSDPE